LRAYLAAYEQGDYARATALFQESLALDRESENNGSIANSLGALGLVAYMQGDYTRAHALLEESLVCLAIWGTTTR
jgi:tetratricopeptide (TPR) repeat protein